MGIGSAFVPVTAHAAPVGTIEGTLTEAGTGLPLAGVNVFAVRLDTGAFADGDLTDDDGHFSVTSEFADDFVLQYRDLLGDGGVVRWNDGATSMQTAPVIHLMPGDSVVHDDVLTYTDPMSTAHTMSGTVSDKDGNALGGIVVTATKSSGATLTTSTNRDGVWALDAPTGDWTLRYAQNGWWGPVVETPWMVTYFPGVWLKNKAEGVQVDDGSPGSVDGLDVTLRRSTRYLGTLHDGLDNDPGYRVYDLTGQLVYRAPDPMPADGIIVPPGSWKILMTDGPHYVPQWLTPGPDLGSPSSFDDAAVFDVPEGLNSSAVYDIWFPTELKPLTPVELSADAGTGTRVGRTVRLTPAVWNQSWETSTRTLWMRDGHRQVGTGPTYRVTLHDAGHVLTAIERATNGSIRGSSKSSVSVNRLRSHLRVTHVRHRHGRIRFVVHASARLGTPRGFIRGRDNVGLIHRPVKVRLRHGRAVVSLPDAARGVHHIDLEYRSRTYSRAKTRVTVQTQ
jgi:hypothetical protein